MGTEDGTALVVGAVVGPAVGDGVEERFVNVVGEVEGVSYRAYLLRAGSVYFNSSKNM